ncbi:MAG: hypothetical protein Q8O89_03840 [Nanoarchaeota archaeon]|nr:hypothetical protein [Nanoarchaeota archaeon]
MYIENLSNEEIVKRMKEFCNKTIFLVKKETRTANETYDLILEVDDWIKAFSKLYKENGSKDIIKVIDHLELMKACSENIGDGQRMSKERIPIKLKEMENLSNQLIAMLEEKPKSNTESQAAPVDEPKPIGSPERRTVTQVLEAEGIESIRINRID